MLPNTVSGTLPMRDENSFGVASGSPWALWNLTYEGWKRRSISCIAAADTRKVEPYLWGMKTWIPPFFLKSYNVWNLTYEGWKPAFLSAIAYALSVEPYLWGMKTICLKIFRIFLPFPLWNLTYEGWKLNPIPATIAAMEISVEPYLWGMKTNPIPHLFTFFLSWNLTYEGWKPKRFPSSSQADKEKAFCGTLPMRDENWH